jgi:hypothetical protein
MSLEPSISGCQVHLVGRFNPVIFHPTWFLHHNLVRPGDVLQVTNETPELTVANPAESELKPIIVLPNLATFDMNWVSIQVNNENCSFTTQQPQYYLELRDLILGTFRLLRYTPISALGINLLYHFPVGRDLLEVIKKKISPPTIFENIPKNNPNSGDLVNYKRRWKSISAENALINLDIEPSIQIENGLYIAINCHYSVTAAVDSINGAIPAMDLLEKSWASAHETAEALTEHVLGLRS